MYFHSIIFMLKMDKILAENTCFKKKISNFAKIMAHNECFLLNNSYLCSAVDNLPCT